LVSFTPGSEFYIDDKADCRNEYRKKLIVGVLAMTIFALFATPQFTASAQEKSQKR
jgi:hypothetical protein